MSNKQNDIIVEDKKEREEELCAWCAARPATTMAGYALGKEAVCQQCFEGEDE